MTIEEYFGTCPECHKSDGFLNVGRLHFGRCETHRTYWAIGSNLFSGWRDEDPATWRENAERLEHFSLVTFTP